MAKRPPLTAAQKARIDFLRETKGWGLQRIANDIKASHGAVAWYCLSHGVEKFGSPSPKWMVTVPKYRTVMRNGHPVRSFTPEDDKKLLELEAKGLSYTDIGKAMSPPRKQNSIRARLCILARHDARKEGVAA